MILSWFRSGFSLRSLANQWNTSVMFCFREIRHIIPILLQKIKVIRLFDEKFLKAFPYQLDEHPVHGALDCTIHRRDRVHPGQYKYYRSDNHCHFLTSQVIVALSGLYAHVAISNGHNNDQVSVISFHIKKKVHIFFYFWRGFLISHWKTNWTTQSHFSWMMATILPLTQSGRTPSEIQYIKSNTESCAQL